MLLYNTSTRKKEEFTTVTPGKVLMYVCGITAYDLCHIGHARSAVVFDVLVRYLRSIGYEVVFARNFTDVDDKIIVRANQEGISSSALAQKYIAAFYEDMDQLRILRADLEPKATEHIGEMTALAQQLIDAGKAYPTPSGDVYFRVRSFEGYGKLSGRDIQELEAGARVTPGEEKEDPLDFALWKAAKPDEPSWPSPWGPGRPGWHIECSAMSEKHLSLPLDIHGGGQDLIFPHHENEIAQTEAVTGTQFARWWVHNGFVQINAEKMSKSLGNFKTIRDIFEQYLPETLRYFLLTKHYRSPIDFTFEAMDEAEKNLHRIYSAKQLIETELQRAKWSKSPLPPDFATELSEHENGFAEAMADDLNSAAALGHLFGVIRLANRLAENKQTRTCEQGKALFERILVTLESWGQVLGVFTQDSGAFLAELKNVKLKRKGIDVAQVEALAQQRTEAKKQKDFAAADKLRDELLALGVEIRDTPQGPVWDVL
jgi:cysteinyl-tRNA synthetase